MTPEDVPSQPGASANPPRPRRRSRRGGRGRGRPAQRSTATAPAPAVSEAPEEFPASEPAFESAAPLSEQEYEEAPREMDDARADDERELPETPPLRAPREPRRDFRPAEPAAVSEAIDEVSRVITSLQQVLETMEEILETLELAEAQKTADEREIHALRDSLRQFHRSEPREPRPARREDSRRRR